MWCASNKYSINYKISKYYCNEEINSIINIYYSRNKYIHGVSISFSNKNTPINNNYIVYT